MPYIQKNQELIEITEEEAASMLAEIETANTAMLEISIEKLAISYLQIAIGHSLTTAH